MPSPSLVELFLVCAALCLLQCAVYSRFLLRLKRGLGRHGAFHPAVSVIVPCKGASPSLRENILAMLGQSYSGPVELICVAPSLRDPAYHELLAIQREPTGRGLRLFSSEAVPTRSSEKVMNLLCGFRQSGPASEVLVFADSDMRVPEGWLRDMVAPLQDPGTGLATTAMLHVPSSAGFWSFLRMVWTGAGIPYLEFTGCPVGHTLAMRRRDFEDLGVAQSWESELADDLSLLPKLRSSAKRVAFVAAAMPVCDEGCGRSGYFRLFDKWMLILRLYASRLWVPGAFATVLRLYILFRALYPAVSWRLLASLWAADLIPLALLFRGYMKLLPDRFRGLHPRHAPLALLAGLAAPLIGLTYLRNFLRSTLSSDMAWGGYTYRIHAPGRIEVISGEESSQRTLRRSLGRLALATAAGILSGLAYLPGAWGALSWCGSIPLLAGIAGAAPAAAFLIGGFSGTLATVAQAPWLPGAFRSAFRLLPHAAVEYSAIVYAYHGLKWALACWVCSWAARELRRRCRIEPSGALSAAFVPAMAAAEGFFPMLFPARLAESQQFFLPMVQSAEIWGSAGIAWLILSFNAAVYAWLCSWRQRGSPAPLRSAVLAGAAAACAANAVWGAWRITVVDGEVMRRLSEGKSLKVGIVQGDMPANRGLPPGRYGQDLALYNGLSREALRAGGLDLLVWPESTYAQVVDYGEDPASALVGGSPLQDRLGMEIPHRVPLLMTAIGRSVDGRERNVSILTDAERRPLGIYEKLKLVPFGEYLPLGSSFPRLHALSPRTARLFPGERPRLLDLPGGARLGPLICYEDFMSDQARLRVRLGADMLVNQTNEAHFGRSLAPEQHLRLSCLRAVETRRFLVRAANCGSSAVVDPAGRIVRSLAAGTRGVIVERAALMDSRTAYAMGGDFLYHLAWIVLAAIGIFLAKTQGLGADS